RLCFSSASCFSFCIVFSSRLRCPPRSTLFPYTTLFRSFSVLVIRLRSLRLLRVSGIVMRLRMFLLLITFLKASHSFRKVISRRNIRSEERFSRNAETDLVCRLLLEKKKRKTTKLQVSTKNTF